MIRTVAKTLKDSLRKYWPCNWTAWAIAKGFALLLFTAGILYGFFVCNIAVDFLSDTRFVSTQQEIALNKLHETFGKRIIVKRVFDPKSGEELWRVYAYGLKDFCDEHIDLISQLGILDSVHLQGTSVTDAGVSRLPTQIRWLDLSDTAVTDECLDQVKRFRSLLALNLKNTRITDAGIALLQDLVPYQNLHRIHLTGNRSVSDKSLEVLFPLMQPHSEGGEKYRAFESIPKVDLQNTAVVTEEYEDFSKELPGVEVAFHGIGNN